MINVRVERPEDIPQIRMINEQAFGQTAEAGIVDTLRASCPGCLSMVAEDEQGLAGHIFFSPAVIENAGGRIEGTGLAPMAVLPNRQRQGIGSALVKCGLELLRMKGSPFVIVLGHPAFYPRFGFEIASTRGLSCQWKGVPDEAFMVLVMDDQVLDGVSGIASFRDEFNAAI